MGLVAGQLKSLSCEDGQKQTKRFDGNRLYLLIKNTGSKLWRFRYKYAEKHQEMALEKYPSISLSKARELAKGARLLLIQGIHPMEERLKNKKALKTPELIFSKISLTWWEFNKSKWGEEHIAKVNRHISNDLKPLHKYSIEQIDVQQIRDVLNELV
ncbi:integrase arm-type DNA-binding domain-containing protein [Pseudoalteromonas luteoviolacea]|uniref:Integrase DNA-binding domain-containing protein n=1 Tax=Pseudoalteromonas luteoviolacea NCIMB 1942 TaxID=1365253 RepID=A0A161Y9T3_9GAMM|nr:integrase arm-type DNA-binding domain-containing protein [Pseudoalteromonas luteoviolacea]KZN53294.1 hypothetical protein N482_24965 [Pseudoalteromonas luteoviolacea NCIMB 1942]